MRPGRGPGAAAAEPGVEGGASRWRSVALAFSSEWLGRLDLRIELRGASVQVAVDTPAGDVHELAQAAGPRLRDDLAVKMAATRP